MAFVDKIKNEFNLNKLKYAGSCRLINSCKLRVPKDGYMFIFYKKNYDKLEGLDRFYALIQNNKEFLAYDFQTQKYLKFDFIFLYFNLFDTNEKYYIFKMEK